MTSKEILAFITEVGIVPVVRCSSAEGAVQAVGALYRGGIRAAEITMTVPGAIRALEKAADQFGDKLVLGAGTVLDPETARACMLAGAEFFVTPSLRASTIEMAKRYSKVICPGALTPTEVLAAWEAGADAVKIFPCGNVGGAKYIKALKGPFPQIEMVPDRRREPGNHRRLPEGRVGRLRGRRRTGRRQVRRARTLRRHRGTRAAVSGRDRQSAVRDKGRRGRLITERLG